MLHFDVALPLHNLVSFSWRLSFTVRYNFSGRAGLNSEYEQLGLVVDAIDAALA